MTRHAGGMFLNQSIYASYIIECAGMTSCNPPATLVDTKQKLSTSSNIPYEDLTTYQSLTGALQYLTFTRPNISYVVQQVCFYMHASYIEHILVLKHILRYVQGTLQYGLHLYPTFVEKLISNNDVDQGGCPNTKLSTFSYCVFLGDNLISQSSKRQHTLSLILVQRLNTKVLTMLFLNFVGYTIFSSNFIFLSLRLLWCTTIMLVSFIYP